MMGASILARARLQNGIRRSLNLIILYKKLCWKACCAIITNEGKLPMSGAVMLVTRPCAVRKWKVFLWLHK